jgi:hypothetical protein
MDCYVFLYTAGGNPMPDSCFKHRFPEVRGNARLRPVRRAHARIRRAGGSEESLTASIALPVTMQSGSVT